MSGNYGLTNVTDPEILPAFRRAVVEFRIAETLMSHKEQQKQWEALLHLTQKPAFAEFREDLLQRLRGGFLQADRERMLQNPAMAEIYKACIDEELIKLRSQ